VNDDIGVAEIQEWVQGLQEIRGLTGNEFARSEQRNHAVSCLRGLLSTTDWDPDAVRDALFGYVKKHLGDPEGILAIDETGFLKEGTASAGVAGQYSGTARRAKNTQIGVFLTYASPAGRTFLDRELYPPTAWIDNVDRYERAGTPKNRVMATKPVPAAEMIELARDAGIEAEWTTGDAV